MRLWLYYRLGWLFCELSFKCDMWGTQWAYALGNWFYGKAIAIEPYPNDDGAVS